MDTKWDVITVMRVTANQPLNIISIINYPSLGHQAIKPCIKAVSQHVTSQYIQNAPRKTNATCALCQHEAKQSVHINPLSSTFLQVAINNPLDSSESCSIPLYQSHYALLLLATSLFLSNCLCLVHVPETGIIEKLVVQLLFRVLIPHATKAAFCAAARTETTVAIDAHLSRPVAAGRVVAHKPAFVVLGRLCTNLALKLSYDRKDRELFPTTLVWANQTVWCTHVRRGDQSFEH